MTGLEVLIPALLPALGDGVRGLFNKLTGNSGSKPANVAEVIQLMEADTSRLRAIAEMEKGGETYMWVEAVRKMQRPVAVGVIISAYVAAALFSDNQQMIDGLSIYAQMVTFYLFGDRSYAYLKKGK